MLFLGMSLEIFSFLDLVPNFGINGVTFGSYFAHFTFVTMEILPFSSILISHFGIFPISKIYKFQIMLFLGMSLEIFSFLDLVPNFGVDGVTFGSYFAHFTFVTMVISHVKYHMWSFTCEKHITWETHRFWDSHLFLEFHTRITCETHENFL